MFEDNVRWQHTGMQVRWLMLTSSAVHHYHGAQEKKTIKNKEIALCSIIIAVLCEDKVTKKEWCKDWFHKRSEKGSHATILHEL